MNITNDQQAFEYLKQLASDKGIDITGAKVRRSSSRFCLGVEHGGRDTCQGRRQCSPQDGPLQPM